MRKVTRRTTLSPNSRVRRTSDLTAANACGSTSTARVVRPITAVSFVTISTIRTDADLERRETSSATHPDRRRAHTRAERERQRCLPGPWRALDDAPRGMMAISSHGLWARYEARGRFFSATATFVVFCMLLRRLAALGMDKN